MLVAKVALPTCAAVGVTAPSTQFQHFAELLMSEVTAHPYQHA